MALIDEKVIQNTKTALINNDMSVIIVKNVSEAIKEIGKIVPESATTGHGGSMTIQKTEIENFLKTHTKYQEDRSCHPGVDYYFSSANAITEEGAIYQVDGFSNRIACLANGPKNVIIIASVNKIVKDEAAAKHRVMTIAAPKNAARFNINTPCTKTGECIALTTGKRCMSPERICANTLIMEKQVLKNRVTVILITDEQLGY